MKDYLINKRLKELCQNETHLSSDVNMMLFEEFYQDRQNNIPLEESDARTLLIMGNRALIYFILKKHLGPRIDYDSLDEFSVGQLGLVKAVDTYDMNSGFKFVSYAYRVIANEIFMYYRKQNLNRCELILDENINSKDDGDGRDLRRLDVLMDDCDVVADTINKAEFERALKNIKYLAPNEAFTILHFMGICGFEKLGQPEIAQRLNMSQSIVSRYLSKGLYKLKVLLKEDVLLSIDESIAKNKMLKNGPRNNLITESDIYYVQI